MKAHETAYQLMKLHVSSFNPMQAQGTARKLMKLTPYGTPLLSFLN